MKKGRMPVFAGILPFYFGCAKGHCFRFYNCAKFVSCFSE
jgi:hypothetical protein